MIMRKLNRNPIPKRIFAATLKTFLALAGSSRARKCATILETATGSPALDRVSRRL